MKQSSTLVSVYGSLGIDLASLFVLPSFAIPGVKKDEFFISSFLQQKSLLTPSVSTEIPGKKSGKVDQNAEREKIKPIRKRQQKSLSQREILELNLYAESERRYPKRKERINYAEAEVPDDDHYLCKICFQIILHSLLLCL